MINFSFIKYFNKRIMKINILINLKNTTLIILLALIITSCGNSGKVKIGFLMPADVGSRWVIDQKYVEEVARKNGCEILTRSAKNDENLQMKQAEELLDLLKTVLLAFGEKVCVARNLSLDPRATQVFHRNFFTEHGFYNLRAGDEHL